MKTLLKLFLLLAAVVYWGYTFIHSPKVENDVVCSKVELAYADSVTDGFIDTAEVEKMLKKENLHPVGKKLDSIKGKAIVACLLKNKYIKTASCYKTPQGVVNIEIAQRKPILRVMPNDGEDYYIDAEGTQLSTSDYLAYVVVASGYISKQFSKEKLPDLAMFLEADTFWKSQISQIYVDKSGKVDLYGRVGEDQVIHFGSTDSIDKKFKHLRAFYDVLPEAGWNTYSDITIAFDNQIVATRRKAESK